MNLRREPPVPVKHAERHRCQSGISRAVQRINGTGDRDHLWASSRKGGCSRHVALRGNSKDPHTRIAEISDAVKCRAILLALLLGICYRHFRCGSGFRARPFHVNETALSECIILTELTADAMAGSTGFSSRHLKDLGGFDESIDLSRDR